MITDRHLENMIARTRTAFSMEAPEVHTERWQGLDISKRPEMVSYELLNWHCNIPLWGVENLEEYQRVIEPNLPWVDDHFLERVGGEPLNPGVQWQNWPWATSADKFREGEKRIFNHTYMERLWPKWAGRVDQNGGKLPYTLGDFSPEPDDLPFIEPRRYPGDPDYFMGPSDGNGTLAEPNAGIRNRPYGDLWSLVAMLADEPLTRQAWIPLFFPEDTGVADGGRKPCTLGYQFIMRDGKLSVYYPLRSCDFVRHFRDDVYLAIRLLLWVLEACRHINPKVWNDVHPGYYTMHCTSLHIFKNDYIQMFGHPSDR